MNRKSSVRLGPGAPSLILIFVVTSMSVLGMLSLMASRSDLRLAERYVQVTQAAYSLMEQAEESRAGLDEMLEQCLQASSNEAEWSAAFEAALSDGDLQKIFSDGNIPAVRKNGDLLEWQQEDGSRVLDCAVRILPME